MFYLVTSLHVNLILLFYFLSLPLRNCEKIKTTDFWGDINPVSNVVTRKPIPWSKITVPNFLLSDADDIKNSDVESFKIFVYVLLSISLLIVLYYCLKCSKCLKACTTLLCGTSDSPRRTQNSSDRISRFVSIDRASRSRIARRIRRSDRQYERLPRGLHNSRRNRNSQNFQVSMETSLVKSQSLDKPPDYSSVILSDSADEQGRFPDVNTEVVVETPPPSYDESMFSNDLNGVK